ncbi:MAG: NTP transferase domain-containing protein [Thermoanaerobaculaceae bacterium]|jgi:molybdenum cofactor cytidylyltransferase|nr:NTP transferase domain-containing protein [Thermoanaerobaculaceae bacterium]
MAQASAGLILAGGRGERFGGPKAFASLPDGRTFLVACASALREAGARPLVATLPVDCPDPGVEGMLPLSLPEPGLDMFASLRLGLGLLLTAPDWDAVVVLPVDHPLVRSATVRVLVEAVGGDALAVRPGYRGKHGHPVGLARSVAVALVSGELPGPTLREVLHAVVVADVDVDDPGVTANCNTPERLAAVLASLAAADG